MGGEPRRVLPIIRPTWHHNMCSQEVWKCHLRWTRPWKQAYTTVGYIILIGKEFFGLPRCCSLNFKQGSISVHKTTLLAKPRSNTSVNSDFKFFKRAKRTIMSRPSAKSLHRLIIQIWNNISVAHTSCGFMRYLQPSKVSDQSEATLFCLISVGVKFMWVGI